ncbi:NAD(P)-dependent oxidoreductase [Paenarthrobacter ilicis]|uniref:NAD-dependent epimerase/dehydratase family protein n=1 Tax=Paenarthrobacter ilicis TaxID=43665 RepID=UPI0028CFDC2C|nr:NAD(P)-dependent oxidoreductase [Paenarthrobacter ilicis]
MKRIAITGAGGNVGTGLRKQLLNQGYQLLLLGRSPITELDANEEAAEIDVRDQDRLTELLRGSDAVVHLAACTTDAAWSDQVSLSIEGTISLFDAARDAGVERVIYASSHHVVGLHPRQPALGLPAELRPDSRYAVGKAFGESIGALYAFKYGMRVLNIRIGNVNTRPLDRRRLGSWLSWEDLGQLVAIGIEHPELVYEIVYGISDATGRNYDNSAAYALGYKPSATSEPFEDLVNREDPAPAHGSAAERSAAELTLGGGFSESEYVGDTDRIFAAPLFTAAQQAGV